MSFVKHLWLASIAVASLQMAVADAHAAYFWYGNDNTSGGNGTWSTTAGSDTCWGSSETSGTTSSKWPGGTVNHAYFYGSPGAVAVASDITCNRLWFNTSMELNGTGSITPQAMFVRYTANTVTLNTPIILSSTYTTAVTVATGNKLIINGLIRGDGGFLGSDSPASTYYGDLYLTNTANTFAGSVNYTGNLWVTKLADGGVSSSLGKGSTAISLGYTDLLTASTLNYNGTTDSSTNRGLTFNVGALSSDATGGAIYNYSVGSSLNFSSTNAWALNWNTTAGYTINLVLGGTSTGTNTIAAVIADSAAVSGVKTGIKVTGSNWVLTGNNSYTGSTYVNAGTLLLDTNGSLASASTVYVAAASAVAGTASFTAGTQATFAKAMAAGMAYSLSSTIDADLGTKATISSTSTSAETISMSWRTRTSDESLVSATGLISDVVYLSKTSESFTLSMTYDASKYNASTGYSASSVYLAYWDGDSWEKLVSSYISSTGVVTATVSSTIASNAMAYAIVPEPSTLVLLAGVLVALIGYAWRKQK